MPDESEVEAEIARIETSEMNDVGDSGFEHEKEDYLAQSRKRAYQVELMETSKRKVCHVLMTPHGPP